MAVDPRLSPSMGRDLQDIRRRLDMLERSARTPALMAWSHTDAANTSLLGAGSSYAAFAGAASLDVSVPPSGRLLLLLAGTLTRGRRRRAPRPVRRHSALGCQHGAGGRRELAALEHRPGARDVVHGARGLDPGATTVTLRAKHVGSGTIVAAALTSQTLVAVPM